MVPKILFEDNAVLVIDKPAGMVVNDAASVKDQTVQGWVAANFQFSIFNFQECRNGIVHRLDKETSGILLIAKTKEAFEELQRQFKEREVEKTYVALAHGRVEPGSGTISVSVGRLPWNRERFGVLPGGREAETRYVVLSVKNKVTCKNTEELSLLELYPKTGRTHQIRIHLKHIGHPIVGDEFYAGRKTARNDRKWCPRLFLHAAKISFKSPKDGTGIQLESTLPEDLQKVLGMLDEVDDRD
ncbi:MAG: hypothetical protein A3D24_01070 [Candidatus Blackburnbacteria bacterium RIFCSPHIGHO2_02_FULL_39_13]|uniref:Pseudouridine synthase n=1 Tax=Candidatus Blackburnbacteria bacterium RIFCSPLOWO2_01_FULL_40_20 TaxID=1797519 RepID=A0A1G1VFJ2_9BACT|nr:MAG: hypothetical protein A2694_04250 [Candidatus Blackburnbacteria bacterium RIFCSPHIGHO2_01_FULL_40_17]OGY08052.1 MAG: hypothetical protein A3D24_01070 [Candidatus Blackburnbacteria bacterium RIFCSPHIGHO2_02_FULL_39_13]OGY14141.1 MAG: hypothetical protein A3A77_04750 [Candidatus Blackburnbacteria bacterium RIFCSPLOWO2_01_FULL_40_20]OGY15437.1 MAG: hypothetical protein A3I52_01875 [Candidatus Blackburnbacteria bacterium RIFCSPLOWO2_02_FULL_40_10]HBL52466.1 RluA family pseudouridine synthase